MLRYFGLGMFLCLAMGSLLARAQDPLARDYRANDYFADAKVAELARAAKIGNVERIDTLLAQGADINAKGKDGVSVLIYSMSGTHQKGFRRLLERGADPNLQMDTGSSAMSFAAGREEFESLRLLLAHGGNPNLRSRRAPPDHTDGTPKDAHGEKPGNLGPLMALDEFNLTPTPLYDAISGRNPENARILLKAGADPNSRNSSGGTPVMSAASSRSYEVMYVLLEGGADFRAADKWGNSVAYYIVDGVTRDPKIALARQKCMAFMEKKGVDFEPEKKKHAEDRRQTESKAAAGMGLPDGKGRADASASGQQDGKQDETQARPQVAQEPSQEISVQPQGEHEKLDLAGMTQAMNTLGGKDDVAKDALIEKIKAAPGDYAPPVFMLVALRLYELKDAEGAYFWYCFGRLRGSYDADRCADVSARQGIGLMTMEIDPQLTAYPKKMRTGDIVPFAKKIVKLDAETPCNYDHRWINLHGMGAFLGGSQELSLPKSQWPGLHKKIMDRFLENAEEYAEERRYE